MNLAEPTTDSASPSIPNGSKLACERIVVFSKRDLLPEWGIEVWKSCISIHLIVCLTCSSAPLS